MLRTLGLIVGGGNFKTVQRYAARWEIPISHFDRMAVRARANRARRRPLAELLVEGSPVSGSHLKARLYDEGVKARACEMCGQGEDWHGRRMSLILDHVNGVRDDNRLENLRIVCPNCAATLETHCGRNPVLAKPRSCVECGTTFMPRHVRHRYCSLSCVGRVHARNNVVPRPERRKVERPPYDVLMAELAASNWSAVGRRYGVSDNAVRKWVRFYEEERERGSGAEVPRRVPAA